MRTEKWRTLKIRLTQFAAGSFHIKKLGSKRELNLNFIHKKKQIRFLSHPLGSFGVTYAFHL